MRALIAPDTKEQLMHNQKETTRELTAVVARNTYLGLKEVRLSERGRLTFMCLYIV